MTNDHRPARPGLTDIPLPGHYEVLTLQVNVSFYRRGGLLKSVMVLRDPIGQIELDRRGRRETEYLDVLPLIRADLDAAIGQLLYLGAATTTD